MKFSSLTPADIASKYISYTQKNLFLTGKAGTGKTTFLREITKRTFKNTVVAAPTGIAAINAGGVTLHSLFQLPFGAFIPEQASIPENTTANFNTPRSLISRQQINAHKRKLINEIELLIIDEVSMLRSDLLDAIDTVLRHIRRQRNTPFGGIQILFIGDMLQLPPVIKKQEWEVLSQYYPSPYFFDARALKEEPPIFVELDKVYRQSDHQFVELLNRLRQNKIDEEDRRILNRFYDESFEPDPEDGYIYITTHNIKANKKNQYELDRLQADSYFYSAYLSGDFEEHAYPHQETLELKEGAQVMFIKNDPTGQQRFFNGKIGKVSYLDQDTIRVVCNDGEEVEVERYEWENKRYTLNKKNNEIEEKTIGTFSQYPLRLAWAITVHKSQGLTFERAILDLSNSFSPGQIYVALSRLTSLNGLVLSSPLPDENFENDLALSSFIHSKPDLQVLENLFKSSTEEYYITSIKEAFTLSKAGNELFFLLKNYRSREKRTMRQEHEQWGVDINREINELVKIGEKFSRQAIQIIASEDLKYLSERTGKAYEFFKPKLKEIAQKINQHIKETKANKKLKSYRDDLKKLEESLFSHNKMMLKISLLLKSVVENKELTKKELLGYQSDKKENNSGNKTPTREVTYQMYQDGWTVEQIAEKRGMVTGTIEGHLSEYVKTGEIKIGDFVSEEKIRNITRVIEEIKENKLSAIKSKLGDEYTYGDIKFVLASRSV